MSQGRCALGLVLVIAAWVGGFVLLFTTSRSLSFWISLGAVAALVGVIGADLRAERRVREAYVGALGLVVLVAVVSMPRTVRHDLAFWQPAPKPTPVQTTSSPTGAWGW